MYTRISPLGFAIHVSEDRSVLMGYPKALTTDRFWDTAGEFETYVLEHSLDIEGVQMSSNPTGFYAWHAKTEVLERFLDGLEDHFFTDDEDDEA